MLKLYFSAQPNCYVKALKCLMLTFTKNYEQGGIAVMKKPKNKKKIKKKNKIKINEGHLSTSIYFHRFGSHKDFIQQNVF